MSAPIRVRIAPSPSGYLHVGTARTAIFNWLFSRRFGGTFLVRIEDTDAERSDMSLVEPILNALAWLGIKADEPIVFQSSRIEHYKAFARKLLETGHGYRCFCTAKNLEIDREAAMAEKRTPMYSRRCHKLSKEEVDQRVAAGEPFAIRLFIPSGETSFDDMVSGNITRQNVDIEDLIVARSDGSAVYNLAVVIDDHEMGVSHVIRGNDHTSNTFKQIHLYRAFGWEVPRFGHVPLILRPDKKKVSKRLGDKDVGEYRHEGIIPEAMFNYLSLLGWSPKTDREIYKIQELVNIFDPEHFNPSNAVFDEEKLVAFNKEHIQLLAPDDLVARVEPLFIDAGLLSAADAVARRSYTASIVTLLKERVRRLGDFVNLGKYFFQFDFNYDPDAAAKQFSPASAELLDAFQFRLAALGTFDAAAIESALSTLADERGVKKAALIHPTRLAVSGMSVGPGLYDLLALLGQTTVVERLARAVSHIRSK